MIPVYKPYLPAESLKYAHQAIDSGWLSSGEFNEKATQALSNLLEVPYVLLTNNGSSACHLLAIALKFKHPEIKKVIVPNNVYIAAINAFLVDKNYELETVDADLGTWNYNLVDLDNTLKRQTEKVAVLIVHNIGNIINVPNLKKKYPDVIFLEDNCEGFLGKYEGAYSGTASLCSAISGYGNKQISVGEMGAFYTHDYEVYKYIKCIWGQGQSEVRFVHHHLGFNYRLCHTSAAILYGQLQVLPTIIEKKKKIFEKYRREVTELGFLIQKQELGTNHSDWMFGLRIPKLKNYNDIDTHFKKYQIEIRPMFYPLSRHKFLNNNSLIKINSETNAEALNRQCIILPSFPELKEKEQDKILQALKEYNAG